MELYEIFLHVGLFFVRLCSVEFYFGPYRISVAAVFVFAALVTILAAFVRRLGD